MFKLKMLHKGLILVGVPLFVGVSFCLVLIVLFQQARADLQRELRARTIVTKTAELTQLYYVNAMRLFVASRVHDPYAFKKFDVLSSAADEDIEDLQRLVTPGSQQARTVQRIETISRELKATITILRRPDKEEFDSFDAERIKNIGRLRNLLSELTNSLVELGSTGSMTERAAAQTDVSRRWLTDFIALGIVIDVLVAAGLTIFFTRAISGRLDALCLDTNHLVREEPLGAPSKESDEIGDLNRTLHQVSGALSDARHKERALTNNAADVICSLNLDLEFVKVNPASQKIWSYQQEELIGKKLNDFVEDPSQLKLCQDGNTVFETGFRHKSGTIVDMHWSSNWSEQDKLYFCVARDISESKQAQRLKQQLMDMVSHDLRSPLTAINGILTLLGMDTYGPMGERALKKINVARKESARLIDLVNNLLELERIDAGGLTLKRRSVSVPELVSRSIDAIAELAALRSIAITVEKIENVSANLDQDRIIQVLLNLLSNAIKFSPEGADIKVSVEKDDEFLTFAVVDSGCGIALSDQPFLFDRFSQITQTNARDGAGLGLAICKHLVELHAGTIGVKSPINGSHGTRFWFKLPLALTAASLDSKLEN